MIRKINVYHIGFLFLAIGVLLRFFYQFIDWSFNGDEINLGKNILQKSFFELLFPLNYGQSAPPLFLWLEKIFSYTTKNFISLKILTFLSSCASLFLFNRIIKNNYSNALYLLLVILFAFNPFIIYNSLTLKQYSVDLMMGLFAVNYFIDSKNILKTYFFFTIWCFLSNVGLLFSAGFVIYNFSNLFISIKGFSTKSIKRQLHNSLPFLTAPLLYLCYFFWFLQQSGAEELKSYMVGYWSDAFLPLNFDIFKWMAYQGKGIYFFFYSTYTLIGIPMLIILIIGLIKVPSAIMTEHKTPLQKVILIYLNVLIVHLTLSGFKMYPFSDRLYLYIAPIVILMFAEGIKVLTSKFKYKYSLKKFSQYSYLLPLLILLSYLTYLPFQDNNVLKLIENLSNSKQTIYYTEKSESTINSWFSFTKYPKPKILKGKIPVIQLHKYKNLESKDIIISRQSHKFGHGENSSPPEEIIQKLLSEQKLKTKKKIDGYTVYEVQQ